MYYVIKKQHATPLQHFMGFAVNKYIAAKNNKNVIFEFEKNGKIERKWVKREDIILLTDNKEFFFKIFSQFRDTEQEQQKLVDQAKKQLDESIENFALAINDEIGKFDEIKSESDIPCILKDY